MSILKRALYSLAFLCLGLTAIHATATELLYTLGTNGTVKVYSVSATTAVTKKLGQITLPFGYGFQIIRTANTPFLYAFGFDPSGSEFLWTYKLNASGVPAAKPIQTLPVKNALVNFVILPNGKFAYAMYSWSMVDPSTGQTGFVGDVTLFTINTKTGLLTNTRKAVINFPINDSFFPVLLGLNTMGTELYTGQFPWSGASIYYLHSTVNPTTGAVSGTSYFFQDYVGAGGGPTGIGDLFMAESLPDSSTGMNAINVYPNAVFPNVLIHCDEGMVPACGDVAYAHILFDPTGKYLLFDDNITGEMPILYVSAPKTKLIASGASIPGLPYLVTFSPSGLLLYATENPEVLVYVFNPHTGLLTARSTIADLDVIQFLPVK